MKVIVGLGNPGREYEMTRHNLGFMLIDRLFSRGNGHRYRSESNAQVAEVSLADQRVLLAKPQTYMNLSGDAVRPLLQRYGDGLPSNLLVASDDVAIPFGMIRVRARGSAGGGNIDGRQEGRGGWREGRLHHRGRDRAHAFLGADRDRGRFGNRD